jgi:hypothetical protein
MWTPIIFNWNSRCPRFHTLTLRDFSHRKAWLVDRLRHLAAIFAIEVCAYAVMETHYHAVLRTRRDIVALWSDREVATRWLILFPQHRDTSGAPILPPEKEISLVGRICGSIPVPVKRQAYDTERLRQP